MIKIKNTKRIIIWSFISVIIVAIRWIILLTDQSQWSEALGYSMILGIIGITYELWMWLKTQTKIYCLALLIGLGWMLFLGLANGAVGIIGSENNPANLMYWAVFAVRIIGSLISHLRSRGMRITLFMTAFVQLSIPVFAFFVWPAQASWGNAGVMWVFVINLIFALLFVVSALLFGRAGDQK